MAFASYGTQYFSNVYDWKGNQYLINIKLSGYTGSATELVHYDFQPITLEWQGGRSQSDLPIWGSNAIFKVYVDETQGQNLDAILTSPYKTYQLEISGNTANVNGETLYWLGYIRPDDSTKSGFIMPKYFVSLGAVDGLADLKNVPYTGATKISGYTSVVQTVQECLDKTGLNIGLRSQNNTTTVQLTGATDILLGLYHRNERFYEKNSTGYTYTNCYNVISYLLESFNCVLSQTGNYKGWTITNKNEINSPVYTYKNDTHRTITGGTYATGYQRAVTGVTFMQGSDQLSYVLPVKQWNATFLNQLSTGQTAANLIPNINFPPTLGTKYWSNGTGSTNFYSFGLGSGYLDLDEPNGFGNPNTAKEITTQIYIVTDGQSGTTLNISCAIKLNKCTFSSGSALPAMQMIVKRPNGTFITDTAINFTGGTKYQTFINQNPIHVLGLNSGVYTLIFKFVPNAGASYNECEYYFTNCFAWVNYSIPAKTLASDYNLVGQFLHPQSLVANSSTIYFSDPSSYFQYYGFPSEGGMIAYNNPGLPTSGWTGYPYPTTKFTNNVFTGSTISPWQTSGYWFGVTDWFSGSSSVVASGVFNTYTLFQPTLLKQGGYTINVNIKNSSLTSGGGTMTLEIDSFIGLSSPVTLGTATLPFDGTYHVKSIGFFLTEPTEIGFRVYRTGGGTDLQIAIKEIDISYTAYDYRQPHYEFYLWSKLKKLQSPHRYINLAIRQPNIYFNSVVYLPLANNYTKYVPFYVTDYVYDVLGSVVQLQLEEITDAFQYCTFFPFQLPTANGQ